MEKKIHPLVTQANQQLREGKITRRDFLRLSTLLGLTVASAEFLAACGTPEAATEAPAAASATEAPVVATEAPATGGIVRGGTLTCATRIERVDNPATFSLISAVQPWRHVIEFLTYTNPQGITEPYLLESWKASDDLLTWTLILRKGIKFNNGQELTADDVMFNFKQWLTESVQSSMFGAMNYLDPSTAWKRPTTTPSP